MRVTGVVTLSKPLVRISELAFDADAVLWIAAVFDERIESRAGSPCVLEAAAAVAVGGVRARLASGSTVRCGPAGGLVMLREINEMVVPVRWNRPFRCSRDVVADRRGWFGAG
ncbi:hypothetical protein AFM11_02765 [Mycolicibacterium wolinskyi]|uniref:Uncharacterized protein n=1 Tax=Mycolicibacterium wolinskyi TaxID=59750 RepID=A0A132PUY2_9MYCO|nr:hypothetical protein AFM11_02765 [Mycolicibacterium wolinskyi]